MQPVRPKRFLGQHFLRDLNIAKKIVGALVISPGPGQVLEVGAGTGVLTDYLIANPAIDLKVIEIDREAAAYLRLRFPQLQIIEGDILEQPLDRMFASTYSVIGNFPYNISSQIFFAILAARERIVQVVCMVQKEVAVRIAAPPGNKAYGILSVLLQAYFSVKVLFRVPPTVFVPRPRVDSAVMRMERRSRQSLGCDEKLFVDVVKRSFNNRRKTLRNALKGLNLAREISKEKVFDSRAEQLSVDEFINLTLLIERSRGSDHPI